MIMIKPSLLLLVLSAFTCATAAADEWKADRLRGSVMAFTDGSWQPIRRGDVVDDTRRIRTQEGAHVTFVRDRESIEIDGASEIRIFDKAGERMTTVVQNYGSVTIDAEHRNVQHFSVQTPFLAAVVKGTRFTVSSDKAGTNVSVSRGMVQVQDTVHSLVTNVPAGLNATVATKVALDVEGSGQKPMVATMDGVVLPPATLQTIQTAAAQGQAVNATTLPAIIAASPAAGTTPAAVTPAAALTPEARADAIPLGAAAATIQQSAPAPVSLGSSSSNGTPSSASPGIGGGGPGSGDNGNGPGADHGKDHGPGKGGPGADDNGQGNGPGRGPGNGPGDDHGNGPGNGPGNDNGPGNGKGPGGGKGGPGGNGGPGNGPANNNGNGPGANNGNGNSGPGNNNGNGPGRGDDHGNDNKKDPKDDKKGPKDDDKGKKDDDKGRNDDKGPKGH